MIAVHVLMAAIAGPLGSVVDIAAGESTCAVQANGRVWCWGTGYFGGPERERRLSAARVRGLRGVTAVKTGGTAWCAVTRRGQLHCWGAFEDSRKTPVAEPGGVQVQVVPGLSRVTDVGVGEEHVCTLSGGDVSCWGSADHILPSLDSKGPTHDHHRIPLPAPAMAIDAGGMHTCSILEDRTVWCWGASNEPAKRHDGPAAGIVGGENRTCVLLDGEDAALECWSIRNIHGQDGHHDPIETVDTEVVFAALGPVSWAANHRNTGNHSRGCYAGQTEVRCFEESSSRGRRGTFATTTADFGGAIQLAVGRRHQCAVDASQEVRCWGQAEGGRLGTGSAPGLLVQAEEVATKVTAFDVAQGEWCASTQTGATCSFDLASRALDGSVAVALAGSGACGILGNGDLACVAGPGEGAELPLLTEGPFDDLDGNADVVCGRTRQGALQCHGQLDQFFGTVAPPSVRLQGVDDFFIAQPGEVEGHGCVLIEGRLACFGANWRGAEGLAPGTAWISPYEESDGTRPQLPHARSLYGDEERICLQLPDDSHQCGPIYLGLDTQISLVAADVPADTVGWAMAGDSRCAIIESGELLCSKGDFRSLDDRGISEDLLPINGLPGGVQDVMLSARHRDITGCALDEQRSLHCWSTPWTLQAPVVTVPSQVVTQ